MKEFVDLYSFPYNLTFPKLTNATHECFSSMMEILQTKYSLFEARCKP